MNKGKTLIKLSGSVRASQGFAEHACGLVALMELQAQRSCYAPLRVFQQLVCPLAIGGSLL